MTTFGSKLTLSKGEFLNLLCSIWNERMTELNIQSGFFTTGIWPLDRGKYPANRFDLRLLQKYKEWKEAGSKELNWDKLANENLDEAIPIDRAPINMHKKDDQLARQNSSNNIAQSFSETDNLLMTQPNDTSSSMPAKNQTLNGKEVLLKHIGPFPYDPPLEGCKWVPNGWKIEKIEYQTKATSSKSFDELFLDKIKGPVNKKKDRFQRCDLRAKLISQPKYLTEFQRKKEEFETKNKKAKTTAKKANQNPKQKKSINANKKW